MRPSAEAKKVLTSSERALSSSAFDFQVSVYSSRNQTAPSEAVPNAFSPRRRENSEQ